MPTSSPTTTSSIPDWQLPPGVGRGTWDYAHLPSIATQYDAFHSEHPLLKLDQDLIQDYASRVTGRQVNPAGTAQAGSISKQPMAIDFGCGTGRSILPLARSGWRTIGVDLSQNMLDEVYRKAEQAGIVQNIELVRSNMVEFDRCGDQTIDLGLCMYSSIGMVQGRLHRRRFLENIRRMLKPDGYFIVHAHNRGTWLRLPKGFRMTLGNWWKSRWQSSWEFGDRVYAYRGLPNMFLHIFSKRELKSELEMAGWKIESIHLLNIRSDGYLGHRWWMPHLRAGGFIAVCRAV